MTDGFESDIREVDRKSDILSDPFLLEIIRNYFITTCQEMGTSMMRTASIDSSAARLLARPLLRLVDLGDPVRQFDYCLYAELKLGVLHVVVFGMHKGFTLWVFLLLRCALM